MSFTAKPLPYATDALQPQISVPALEAHHGEHYRDLVAQLNAQLTATPAESADDEAGPEELIDLVRGRQGRIQQLAAEVWHHEFFWKCLSPQRSEPEGALRAAIDRDFGGLEALRETFVQRNAALFGGGWLWLVRRPDGRLGVLVTANAATPLTGADWPLLACDLWEHAHYLDHHGDRAGWLAAFWARANWRFASARFEDPT
ncbi:superoxide dismutase [Coralloluteibacterium stylophorae]|uniref:Superoxide dismutase n=1 Tax=Coralloluteibacterium stylophorae TaxID=1776034 RepID=A0A8J7VXD7_9GAMM|nr:superoxide dismutase [Coralloluteibacterium stylophorae]MBS7456670.1 superoxide dismutase [Coralloluteibacterium stylophorae]